MFPNDQEIFLKQLLNEPIKFTKRVTGSNRWRFIAWCSKKGIVEPVGVLRFGKNPMYIVKHAFEIPDSNNRIKLYLKGSNISFSNTRMR